MSERPIRAFVAVLLPDGVRTRLAAMVAEIRPKAPALAWVRADNLHVTLRFLGAVEPAALARAEEAMREAAAAGAPFSIELGGLGSFPAAGPPRIVWAGVAVGGPELGKLQGTLATALAARGFPGEDRAFHPHVTLARAREGRRGGAQLAGLLGPGPGFGRLRVEALHLMRSDLGPGGSRYSVLAEAPLAHPSGETRGWTT